MQVHLEIKFLQTRPHFIDFVLEILEIFPSAVQFPFLWLSCCIAPFYVILHRLSSVWPLTIIS